MTTPTIKARPTLYKGIQMRSRLEADFAGWLDREKKTWQYEPRAYASDRGQWLPDFEIERPDLPVRELIELKPASLLVIEEDGQSITPDSKAAIDDVLCKMSVAWASEPDLLLSLLLWSYGGEQPGISVASRGIRYPWLIKLPHVPALPWPGAEQIVMWDADDAVALRGGPLACSFCRKSQRKVRKLVTDNRGHHICDECVGLCDEILAEQRP